MGIEMKIKNLVLSFVLLGIVLSSVVSCDYTAKFYPTTYQLSDMEFVSVLPAKKEGDEYKPACEGEFDSLIFRLNFMGMGITGEEVSDKDLSLRPGDILKAYGHETKKRFVLSVPETVNESNFTINIKCMEPYPDVDLGKEAKCQGAENPVSNIAPNGLWYSSYFSKSKSGYYPRTFEHKDLLGVAILIDQSGSMKGFIDKKTGQEANEKKIDKTDFQSYGSDVLNHRLGAVITFLKSLNPTEKSIVFQFGEGVSTSGEAKVVCYNPDNKKEIELRADCYGTKRELVLGTEDGKIPSQLKSLETDLSGRTPLWAAVMDVYDFMSKVKNTEVRHVIVIGDGPDTCHETSPHYNKFMGDTPCANFGYEDFKARVLADLGDANAKKVHVSFIQFQSYGYRERDPRQQEIACLTGGHYIFVNTEDIADELDQAHQEALERAMMRLRYALTGSWAVALQVGAQLKSEKIPRGSQIALEGDIVLNPGELTAISKSAFMRIGVENTPIEGLNILDLRASFRLPCAPGTSDCSWFKPTQCLNQNDVTCSGKDRLCMSTPKEDFVSCSYKDTNDGVCCKGYCVQKSQDEKKSCEPFKK